VEKCDGVGQDMADNIKQRMRFVCLLTKAKIHTRHKNILNLTLFHGCNIHAKALQCCVLLPLSILPAIPPSGFEEN